MSAVPRGGRWRQKCSLHILEDLFLVKLQALVYDTLPSTTAVFSYAIGSSKLSANEQFFVGAQTVVSLLQTAQIKQGMSFIAANKVYTSTCKTTIVWIETRSSFFYPGGCASCLRACLGARLLRQSYQYPNLSEGADRVGGRLRRDKECPFSGVTKSGRVWTKVPESGARSVGRSMTTGVQLAHSGRPVPCVHVQRASLSIVARWQDLVTELVLWSSAN